MAYNWVTSRLTGRLSELLYQIYFEPAIFKQLLIKYKDIQFLLILQGAKNL